MKLSTLTTALLILQLLFSCAKVEENQQKKPQKVKITAITPSTDRFTKVVTGTSFPNKEVNLSFRVNGPLTVFDVEEGQYFKKGELIGMIDQRDYQLALNNAKATLKWSKQEFERAKQLISFQNISQQEYDQLEINYINAQHQLETAKNAFNDTKLIAPFDGFVKKTFTERGEHLSVSQKVVTFQDYSKLKVNCVVNEDIALHPEKINSIFVVFDGLSNDVFSAKLVEVSRDTEGMTNAYPCVLEVNENQLKLIGGMTSEIYFELSDDLHDYVTIPSSAVINRANGEQFVWGIHPNNHTLFSMKVKVNSLLNDGLVQVDIIDKTEAQFIVAAGGTYLSDGQQVRYTVDEPMITAKN
ncbi:efflux RND transporter periplasmic adaptor subunit [Flammeovirga pacifica]|uniref:Uncharacterized protein n=1 Tax=Flammeovirga pacifica TaxID=915059 RepID=A0A1S1YSQ0_FLAPC|nr:efflux RND transporter periplasmic adaptor subunit [Flammeovirga pacifica]OHX64038.1 hypothetical protein NH26_20735 [Flammeovirga pacifica]